MNRERRIRAATEADLDRIVEIEACAYPDDAKPRRHRSGADATPHGGPRQVSPPRRGRRKSWDRGSFSRPLSGSAAHSYPPAPSRPSRSPPRRADTGRAHFCFAPCMRSSSNGGRRCPFSTLSAGRSTRGRATLEPHPWSGCELPQRARRIARAARSSEGRSAGGALRSHDRRREPRPQMPRALRWHGHSVRGAFAAHGPPMGTPFRERSTALDGRRVR